MAGFDALFWYNSAALPRATDSRIGRRWTDAGEETLERDLNSSARTSPQPGRTRATPTGKTANARAYLRLKHAVLSGAFRPGEVVTLR